MVNLYMKQEMGRSFLIFPLDNKVSEYQLKMITGNSIDGLISSRMSEDGEQTVLMYDITNMKSLRKEYSGIGIEFEEIKLVFESIQKVLNTGDRYLLDEKGFILDPSYIMRDMETNEIRFIYLPLSKTDCDNNELGESQFHQLADFLIERVNHKDEKSVSIAYQFYSMSKEDTFSVRLFTNIIEKEDIVSDYDTEVREVSEETPVNQEIFIDENEEVHWKSCIITGFGCALVPAVYYCAGIDHMYMLYMILLEIIMSIILLCLVIRNIYKLIQIRSNNIEMIPDSSISVDQYWGGNQETQFFDDKTTFFDQKEENADICFEWKEKGITKKYRATHFPIVIGKLMNEVDCRIDDPSISRMHVKINRKGNSYSILDLNSTNGTLVDGVKIRPGEEIAIDLCSEIMLGQVILRMV